MYKKNVSTLGKIKCSQKSVYSCILPFMISGVEKYLPLRSADSFRFAALGPSVASLCHP